MVFLNMGCPSLKRGVRVYEKRYLYSCRAGKKFRIFVGRKGEERNGLRMVRIREIGETESGKGVD